MQGYACQPRPLWQIPPISPYSTLSDKTYLQQRTHQLKTCSQTWITNTLFPACWKAGLRFCRVLHSQIASPSFQQPLIHNLHQPLHMFYAPVRIWLLLHNANTALEECSISFLGILWKILGTGKCQIVHVNSTHSIIFCMLYCSQNMDACFTEHVLYCPGQAPMDVHSSSTRNWAWVVTRRRCWMVNLSPRKPPPLASFPGSPLDPTKNRKGRGEPGIDSHMILRHTRH